MMNLPNQSAGKITNYKVKCLDSSYDEENGMLVLNCHFVEENFQRIIFLHKSDLCFKGSADVPDIEMYRTAKMFKKFPYDFTITISDDTERKVVDETNYASFVNQFQEEISDEMGKVTEGMIDEAGQIQRKLGKLMDSGKLDVKKLMESELGIRAKISKI